MSKTITLGEIGFSTFNGASTDDFRWIEPWYQERWHRAALQIITEHERRKIADIAEDAQSSTTETKELVDALHIRVNVQDDRLNVQTREMQEISNRLEAISLKLNQSQKTQQLQQTQPSTDRTPDGWQVKYNELVQPAEPVIVSPQPFVPPLAAETPYLPVENKQTDPILEGAIAGAKLRKENIDKALATANDFKDAYRSCWEWCNLLGIEVLDPDGWRNSFSSVTTSTPICLKRFLRRANQSTCSGLPQLEALCRKYLEEEQA